MKQKNILLSILLVLSLIFSAVAVSAEHDASLDIDPKIANCEQLGNTFTVTVDNDGTGTNAILQVEIYKALAGLSEFVCGDSPSGWSLLPYSDRCIYVTGLESEDKIDHGESLDFTFQATMSSSACVSNFIIVTVDDEKPTGDRNTENLGVKIDCQDPTFEKWLNDEGEDAIGVCPPNLQAAGEECWIRQDMGISFTATDNVDDSVSNCNLGIDYCEWSYTVDGTEHDSGVVNDMDDQIMDQIDIDVDFNEDSVHELTITCYDIAGNTFTDVENFRVDSTKPETTKTYGAPSYPFDINVPGDYPHYITTSTLISLAANDPDPTGYGCDVGVEQTWSKVTLMDSNDPCNDESECVPLGDDLTHREQVSIFTPYDQPFSINEESCHMIEFYSVDSLGNVEVKNHQCVFVDDSIPLMEKTVGSPSVKCDVDDVNACHYYVTQATPMTLDCYANADDPHPVGDYTIHWEIFLDKDDDPTTDDWESKGTYSKHDSTATFYFGEDSRHKVEYYCVDGLDKQSQKWTEIDVVDTVGPVITKTVSGHKVLVDPNCDETTEVCDFYVTQETDFEFDCVDQDPHPVGVDYMSIDIFWKKTIAEDWPLEPIHSFVEDSDEWTFSCHQDSAHKFVYSCVDLLGNPSTTVEEIDYTDSVAPETDLTISEPRKDLNGVTWIDGVTNLTLETEDPLPHPVGEDKIMYRITEMSNDACWNEADYCLVNDDMTGFVEYTEPLNHIDESCHMIEFYAVDLLGNEEVVQNDCFFVDRTAPLVTIDTTAGIADSGETEFMTSENTAGDFTWVTQDMAVTLTCEDQGPHPSYDEELCFMVSWDEATTSGWGDITQSYCDSSIGGYMEDSWCCVDMMDSDSIGSVYDFKFKEDSMHKLDYKCRDAVEKTSGEQTAAFKVDTVAPTVDLTLEEPFYGDCGDEEPVVIGADCEIDDDCSSMEQCIDGQCMYGIVFDDSVKRVKEIYKKDECFVDTATRISLTHVDGGDICAIGQVSCRWRYDVSGDDYFNSSDWMTYDEIEKINFPEECYHTLYVECSDALENTWSTEEHYTVDKSKPITTSAFSGPHVVGDYAEWINDLTMISLNAEDPQPHPSGVAETSYRVSLVNDEYCNSSNELYMCDDAVGQQGDWIPYNGEFNIPQESCHMIEYFSVDNVKKTEDVVKRCVYVDTTAPTPVKTVGKPNALFDGTFSYYEDVNGHCNMDINSDPLAIDCWEVTKDTPISLSCVDATPHPVGQSGVYFKVDWDATDLTEQYCDMLDLDYNMTGDGFCFSEVEITDFKFMEDTEHRLTYYCVDALGNSNADVLDEEMFKVNGEAFTIQLNKKWNLISVPFKLLDDSPEVVFADIADKVKTVRAFDGYNWHGYTPDGVPNDDLDKIEPGWGYWVLMEEEAELLVGGSLYQADDTSMPEVPIVKDGWNLIGYYDTDMQTEYVGPMSYNSPVGSTTTAGYNLASLRDSLFDENTPSLYTWWEPFNTDMNPFTRTLVGLNSWSDMMDPGAGYWLYYSGDDADTKYVPVSDKYCGESCQIM